MVFYSSRLEPRLDLVKDRLEAMESCPPEARSVPLLLALLASALEAEARAAAPAGARPCGDDAGYVLHRDVGRVCYTSEAADHGPQEVSTLRIRRLRRAYNVLLFGGPSHEEIVEQAELEDACSSLGPAEDVAARLSSVRAAEASELDDECNPITRISASIATMSFELRRARKFDPANALEGLVDDLVSTHGGSQGLQPVESAVMLLMDLRGEGSQAPDADDWEVIGPRGRRVLEKLYSNSVSTPEESSRRDGVEIRRQGDASTSDVPVAAFFRHERASGRGKSIVFHKGEQGTAGRHDTDASAVPLPSAVVATGRRNRFLLPNDCLLYQDTSSTGMHTSSFYTSGARRDIGTGLGSERMAWYTVADFSSERGIPDVGAGELNGTLVATPLSPSAWTKPYNRAAGGDVVPPSPSGGPEATPGSLVAERLGASGASRARTTIPFCRERRGHGRGYDLDLCGALSRANVDERAPAVKELCISLSFPGLEENFAPDLLEAAQTRLAGPTNPIGTRVHAPSRQAGVQDKHAPWRLMRPYSKGELGTSCKTSGCGWGAEEGSEITKDFASEPLTTTGNGREAFDSEKLGIGERGAHFGCRAVGWEHAEANWDNLSLPVWGLVSPALVAREGGPGAPAFEVCHREHFRAGTRRLEAASKATVSEAEMIRRVFAAIQGVPSTSFIYDSKEARMRVAHRCELNLGSHVNVKEAKAPRVHGLSYRALASLLQEFASAGTWFRRVELCAAHLSARPVVVGQVAQAFGLELRRQLSLVQAAIIESRERLAGDDAEHDADRLALRALTGVLFRTIALRRALRALADICGVADEDLNVEGGIAGVVSAFPRGADLLTHLYKTAEARAASKLRRGHAPGNPRCGATLPEETESAMALLSRAAAPYLAMLSAWLWSGQLQLEDDLHGEFPIRCRTSSPAGMSDEVGDSTTAEEPWMKDGGGSFMSLAFRMNETAATPCFLGGGVLEEATRAGKLLRMLTISFLHRDRIPRQLSSPDFSEACAASPPRTLSMVGASRGLDDPRDAALGFDVAAAAARWTTHVSGSTVSERSDAKADDDRELCDSMFPFKERGEEHVSAGPETRRGQPSSSKIADEGWRTSTQVVGLGKDGYEVVASPEDAQEEPQSTKGGGILSLVAPPTAEETVSAATALREKYRRLGEESDARAALARWRRGRAERVSAASVSLKQLYNREAKAWRSMAAGAAMDQGASDDDDDDSGGGVQERTDVDVPEDPPVASAPVREGDHARINTIDSALRAVSAADADEGGWVELEAADDDVESANVRTEEARARSPEPVEAARLAGTGASEAVGTATTGVNELLGTGLFTHMDAQRNIKDEEPNQDKRCTSSNSVRGAHAQDVKFSPITILEEPGGKSTGVAESLTSWTGVSYELPSERFSHRQQASGEVSLEQDGKRQSNAPVPGTGKSVSEHSGYTLAADNDSPERFSHVKIVQEPGGKSTGVADALGVDAAAGAGQERGADEAPPDTREPPADQSSGATTSFALPTALSQPVVGGQEHLNAGDARLDEKDRTWDGTDRPTLDGDTLTRTVYVPKVGTGTGSECSLGVLPLSPERPDLSELGAARSESWRSSPRDEATRAPKEGTNAGADGKVEQEASGEERCRDVPVWAGKRRRRLQENHPEMDFTLPLDIVVQRCVRDPVLAQCRAIDAAALAFFVREAGVLEHLSYLRTFLLGLDSDFLQDFTLRLLEGLCEQGIDWRRQSNLNAAFAESAAISGLDTAPLARTFWYEVDPTCGGVLGTSFSTSRDDVEKSTASAAHPSTGLSCAEAYSPSALSFVSPVLAVPWPVGMLLPRGVLHTYRSIHRCLFRHRVTLHRLRRLRATLRGLDALLDTRRQNRHGGLGGDSGEANVRWDRERLHWMHLFRHEMQHVADSLQTFFAEQAEGGWPELRGLCEAQAMKPSPQINAAGSGLAILADAHVRYISNMHLRMFLGTDREGVMGRAGIEDFYGVVCSVGRVTDQALQRHGRRTGQIDDATSAARAADKQKDGMLLLLPDDTFSELADARERFGDARRGLCDALSELRAADGGGGSAESLLVALGCGSRDSLAALVAPSRQ